MVSHFFRDWTQCEKTICWSRLLPFISPFYYISLYSPFLSYKVPWDLSLFSSIMVPSQTRTRGPKFSSCLPGKVYEFPSPPSPFDWLHFVSSIWYIFIYLRYPTCMCIFLILEWVYKAMSHGSSLLPQDNFSRVSKFWRLKRRKQYPTHWCDNPYRVL